MSGLEPLLAGSEVFSAIVGRWTGGWRVGFAAGLAEDFPGILSGGRAWAREFCFTDFREFCGIKGLEIAGFVTSALDMKGGTGTTTPTGRRSRILGLLFCWLFAVGWAAMEDDSGEELFITPCGSGILEENDKNAASDSSGYDITALQDSPVGQNGNGSGGEGSARVVQAAAPENPPGLCSSQGNFVVEFSDISDEELVIAATQVEQSQQNNTISGAVSGSPSSPSRRAFHEPVPDVEMDRLGKRT